MTRRVADYFEVTIPLLLIATAAPLIAQGLTVVSGAAFEAAVPRDFYLEGNAIPVEKRNAALLQAASGKRLLLALLDTSGYSSQVQSKYAGMLIAEAPVRMCGRVFAAGSYGFGLRRPAQKRGGTGELTIYDQGGERVGGCTVEEDRALQHPVPLQAIPKGASGAEVYLGRYHLFTQISVTTEVGHR